MTKYNRCSLDDCDKVIPQTADPRARYCSTQHARKAARLRAKNRRSQS